MYTRLQASPNIGYRNNFVALYLDPEPLQLILLRGFKNAESGWRISYSSLWLPWEHIHWVYIARDWAVCMFT